MAEPLKIGMIMGKWVGGGVESVIMNYYRHIDRSKIQFDFICDSDSTDIPYEEIEKLGGKVILCPPYQKVRKYTKELIRIFKENNYKIVHSNINTLSVIPLRAAKKANVPVRIAHSHSTIVNNKREWKRNLIKNILKHFSKKYATDYYACSDLAAISQFGEKSYKNGEVDIFNNSIELDLFKYNEKLRKEKKKELKIKNDSFVIGHIGRFVETKNHSFIIDIFNEIKKNNNKAILILVGQGPLLDEIRKKVNSLGLNNSVLFLGQRKDVNELYQVFDVFVLPSLYEGFPVVGVEAQASGILCYLSNNMTKNAKIVDSTVFMSLDNSSKEWADKIIKDSSTFVRKNTEFELTKAGFNIKESSKKLEEKYESYIFE